LQSGTELSLDFESIPASQLSESQPESSVNTASLSPRDSVEEQAEPLFPSLHPNKLRKTLQDPELEVRVRAAAEEDEDGVWKDGVLLVENASPALLAAAEKLLSNPEEKFVFKFYIDHEAKKIWIVDLVTGDTHDYICRTFFVAVERAIPLSDGLIAGVGTATVRGADGIGRKPDESWKPALPLPLYCVLEVGVSQPITGGPKSLYGKRDQWFAQYPSIHTVIIVHVSNSHHRAWVEVWERNPAPGAGGLPATLLAAATSHPGVHGGAVAPVGAPPAGVMITTNAHVTLSHPGGGAVLGRVHFDRRWMGLGLAGPVAVPHPPHYEIRFNVVPIFLPNLPVVLPGNVSLTVSVNLTALAGACCN
jgi:hypothetical protein